MLSDAVLYRYLDRISTDDGIECLVDFIYGHYDDMLLVNRSICMDFCEMLYRSLISSLVSVEITESGEELHELSLLRELYMYMYYQEFDYEFDS